MTTTTTSSVTANQPSNSTGIKHLECLKIVHFIMAIAPFIGAVYFLALGAWFFGSDVPAFTSVISVGLGVLCLALGSAFVVTGKRVSMGQGRIFATVMAATCVGQLVGVLAALYTVWVCWFNPETKAVFDQGGL